MIAVLELLAMSANIVALKGKKERETISSVASLVLFPWWLELSVYSNLKLNV